MLSARIISALHVLLVVGILLLLIVGVAAAQTPAGTLRGQVSDPTGASIVGATVLLTTPSGDSMDLTTDKLGNYEFTNLTPGTYDVKAVAKGFALFDKPGVVIVAGQLTRVNISLQLETRTEKVLVNDTSVQVDVNPANNANTIVLQGKDLDALSDDPDDLASELQALAGPSAGPNGGQIYIDGFTGGQLPPKASIREIRINQNPFSAEYDRLGYGRVEILTKPGTDKLHGQIFVSGNDSSFNARNPLENLGPGVQPPGYYSTQYSGNIGGSLSKKASFFFNVEYRTINDLGIINTTIVDPNTFQIVPFSEAVPNPETRLNLSPRLDYQLTPSNTLTVRYQYWRNNEDNGSVRQNSLAQLGGNDFNTEHTVQVTDTQTLSPHAINEIRFQYNRDFNRTTPFNTSTTVSVNGAFTGNGSGGFADSDIQNRYELQNTTFYNNGKHAWKFGGRFRETKDVNFNADNYAGSFSFGPELKPASVCTPSPNNPCVYQGIEVYQIVLQQLANGLTIPQIRSQFGVDPSFYTQTAGNSSASVSLIDVGLFVQDDWKVRQNVTISYGLRFESQNNFPDKASFSPRIGVAWGIGGNAKNPPKTVLRGGFGIFYDRFTYGLVLTQERLNGTNQQKYQVANPDFYLTDIPPVNQLPVSTTAPTIYETNNNLRAPYTMQTGITLERQITKSSNIAVTYLNSRGVHQFYTNNLNPVDPATGLRVNGINENLFQYQSEGTFKQNQIIVNGSIRMGQKLSIFGYYTYNRADSNASGAGSFPSDPFNLQQDWGRASFDVRHRLFMGGSIGLPYNFRLSPFMIASSGIPFNITSGNDLYGDALYNTRPAFADCTSAIVTKYGCFGANPVGGYTPIPINYAEAPGRFSLNMRLAKTFGLGPVIENANANAGGGGMSGGTFGRPGGGPGGPGGRGGMGGFGGGGTSNRRYNLTLGLNVRNIFNNVNLAPPIGNLSSPQFGESNALAGRPYSDSTSNRRIDLQLTFAF